MMVGKKYWYLHMKGALPWLVRWARRAVTRNFCPALTALVGLIQNFFPHCTLVHFICPLRPARWAGSRAGSPVFNMCLWAQLKIFVSTDFFILRRVLSIEN
jgi:hypothetical protein